MTLNEKETKKIMRNLVVDCVDESTGEVNCTQLAEIVCQEMSADFVGGPLDDDLHPVWDWSVDVGQAWERNPW